MISLQDICDLPLQFDDFTNRFQIPKNVNCAGRRKIKIGNLHPTLLNKSVVYPENVYDEYSICMEDDVEIFNNEMKYDLMVLPSGLLGIEFVKSHIFYHPITSTTETKFSCVVEGVQGVTTIIMQKNALGEFGQTDPIVEEGIIVDLQPKEKFAIPEGYYYTFVNCTEQTSIISRVYKNYHIADYNSIKSMRGLAYFCIRKNAKQEVVFNPHYRKIPAIKQSTAAENHFPRLNFDCCESLYMIAKRNTEIFMNILAL